MDYILEISNLSKAYGGKMALNNFNLTLERGKILGLLGPNGSGKTTFMKVLSGLLNSYEGNVSICGNKPSIETKKIVAYVPDKSPLYKWMKVKDAIKLYEDFFESFDKNKIIELLEFMEIHENMKITALSKGMLEKLNLSLTLARKADLYIIDEPLSGVDPIARDKILDAIINNYCEDSSMIITTHIVHDIERIFDEVAFINEGTIIEQGEAESLRMKYGKSIEEIYKIVLGNQEANSYV